MTPHTQVQSKTFFEHLQNTPGLDLRDKRGKRHPMAVVLLEFTLAHDESGQALLCNRDGCLSSIHRHIVNHHGRVMEEVKLSLEKAVSRSQLPVVLCKVSLPVFEDLVFKFYGIELKDEEKQWFAADGKELRGSIAKGGTRGEVVVLAVRHSDRVVVGQEHHNGMKESEIPSVRILLDERGLLGQKVSKDALHLNPDTLQAVQEAGGRLPGGAQRQPSGNVGGNGVLCQTSASTTQRQELRQGPWPAGHTPLPMLRCAGSIF